MGQAGQAGLAGAEMLVVVQARGPKWIVMALPRLAARRLGLRSRREEILDTSVSSSDVVVAPEMQVAGRRSQVAAGSQKGGCTLQIVRCTRLSLEEPADSVQCGSE